MNIAGPLASLIFAITVLTVFGGLFAYGVYKARERTRKKPAATKKVLQYFVEYSLPTADAALGPGGAAVMRPAPSEGRPWGLYLISLMAIGGLFGAGIYYYKSAKRLVLQGAWSTGTGPSKEFPGPPDRPRLPRGEPIVLTKLQSRRPSLFPKALYDANHDEIISVPERARLQQEVPQKILLTVDDNGQAQGLRWLFETLERAGIWGKVTFFITGNYAEGRPSYIGGPITQWWNTLSNENFIGIHGQTHAEGSESWGTDKWLTEHNATINELTQKVTAPEGWSWRGYPWGSRAPYLTFGDSYFAALDRVNPKVVYDASMIVHPTGNNFTGARDLTWPFALTDGIIPADAELPFSEATQRRVTIEKGHAIIEVPVYAWALRKKAGGIGWIPSLDVNIFKELGCPGEGAHREIIEAFESNLKAHYEGNRAPFHLGLHAQNYTLDKKCERATVEAILARVKQYIDTKWVIEYESMPRLLEWMARE